MKSGRIAIVWLLVIAATGLAVGGCGKVSVVKNTGGQPALGLAASASVNSAGSKKIFLAAVQKLHTMSYKYHSFPTNGMTTIDAAVDLTHSAISQSTIIKDDPNSAEIDVIQIGPDYWLSYGPYGWVGKDVRIPAGKYVHLAVSKLGVYNRLASQLNQVQIAANLSDAVGEVTQVDSQHFTGTIDLAKLNAKAVLNQDAQTHAPDSVKTPQPATFTAVLDSQGRLTDLKVKDGIESDWEVSYSDYGTVTVSKPAASKTVEASQSVYDLFKDDGSSK